MKDEDFLGAMLADWFRVRADPHDPPCDDEYCGPCAAKECPHADPLHRHHDGCPSESYPP
jgi:hypothetical protein